MDSTALIARVRKQTLVSTTELSDTDILDYLNEALLDVASRAKWPFLYGSGIVSLVDGTTTYDLPAGVMFLEQLYYDNQGTGVPLVQITAQDAQALYGDVPGDSTLPNFYYRAGEQITFVPTPDAAQDVIVKFYGTPTEFDEEVGGTPPWHASFHTMLADFAIGMFWEREEQEDKSQFYMTRYFDKLRRMFEFYSVNFPVVPLVIGGGLPRFKPKPYTNWPE